jgi:hypothetical protein
MGLRGSVASWRGPRTAEERTLPDWELLRRRPPGGTRSWASVHPWGSGQVFQNFADPDLEHWAQAYHGPNYTRLVQVKARYDPSNLFQFPQSLPLHP